MNTANLQLEGLYLVIATLNEVLVTKGLATRDEIHHALRSAEETAISDYNVEEMSPANRDAVAFPARILQLALRGSGDGQVQPFSELAKLVGQTKEPYNDQQ
jgi:hypothetical protein